MGGAYAKPAVHALIHVVHFQASRLGGQPAVDQVADAVDGELFIAVSRFIQNQLPGRPGSAAAFQGDPHRRLQAALGQEVAHHPARAWGDFQHGTVLSLVSKPTGGQGRRAAHFQPAELPKTRQIDADLRPDLGQAGMHEHLHAVNPHAAIAAALGRAGRSLRPAAGSTAASHRVQGELGAAFSYPG